MIAKIIAWGEDREAALDRLRRALAKSAVLGVQTNLLLLVRIVSHPDFVTANIDTGFIERHRNILLAAQRPASAVALAAATLSRLCKLEAATKAAAARSGDRDSPWARIDGWTLNGKVHHELIFGDGTDERTIVAMAQQPGWLFEIGDRRITGTGDRRHDGNLSIVLDGVHGCVTVLGCGPEMIVMTGDGRWRLVEIDPLAVREGEDPSAGRLTAPMPGRVAQLLVGIGERVRRGEPLMVIEAMKMEHTIAAPADGTVDAVRYAVGDLVEEGAELISLDTSADGGHH